MLKAFNETTEARLGGASYQWVYKSCKQFKYIFNNADKIQTPLLIFSAEDEVIVNTESHKKFMKKLKKLKKDANGYFVPNAMHELYIERDKARIDVLTKILDFFESFAPNTRLHNIWAVVEYNGEKLERKNYGKGLPRFELNTTKSRVTGYDGCNTFNGQIDIENNKIKFSKLTKTKEVCKNQELTKNLVKNINNKEFEYKFENNKLLLTAKNKVVMILKNID